MKKVLLLMVLVMPALASCVQKADADEPKMDTADVKESGTSIVKGEAVVFLSDEMSDLIEADVANGKIVTKSMDMNNALDELGIVSIERLFPYAGRFEARTRAEGLHKWYKIVYSKSVSATKAEAEFEAMDGVEIFEQRRAIKLDSFNDPRLKEQWHYYNDGSLKDAKAGIDINVEPVWQQYTTGDPSVIVSVVDAGVDFSHEDLGANCDKNISKSFVAGYALQAGRHGTHVAGTIAAVNNNGKGVCGIAGGNAAAGKKGVTIMSCQIFANNASGTQVGGDTDEAIKWGADHGAVISQNSWSFTFDTYQEAKSFTLPSSTKAAIDYFNKYAGMDEKGQQEGPMAGGVVFFSAGNDGWDVGHPASYDGVIAVGSVGAQGERAYYSSFGSWVDICAPGGSVDNIQVLSTVPDNGYAYMQGTSMSCPHASGAAALVVSYCGGPGFTRQMLIDKMLKSANTEKVSKTDKIGGLLDVYAAINYGDNTKPEKVEKLSGSIKSNTATFTCKVPSFKGDMPANGISIIYGTDKQKVLSANPKNPSATSGVKSKNTETATKAVGEEVAIVVEDLEFESDYYFVAYSYSGSRVFSDVSNVVELSVGVNTPPVITCKYAGSLVFKPFQTATLPFEVSDPDGHSITLNYTSGSPADNASSLSSEGTFNVYINAAKAQPGKYTFVVKVTDKYGAYTEKGYEYTVLENRPPKVVKQVDNVVLGKAGDTKQINIAECFYDEDEEPLYYTVSSSSQEAITAKVLDGTLTLTSMKEGYSTISVTAADAKGKTATLSFAVLSRDPSKPVDVYPNPTDRYVNVRLASQSQAEVTIVNKVGAKVFSASGKIDPFTPMQADLNACASGVYYVSIKTSSNTYTYPVVKL